MFATVYIRILYRLEYIRKENIQFFFINFFIQFELMKVGYDDCGKKFRQDV